jgi:hypothetical protein
LIGGGVNDETPLAEELPGFLFIESGMPDFFLSVPQVNISITSSVSLTVASSAGGTAFILVFQAEQTLS